MTPPPDDASAPSEPPAPAPTWRRVLREPGLWLLVIAALVAWPLGRYALRSSRPPLPILGTVPDFRFTDHLGRPAGSEQLRGHAWIAGFVFTRCPSTCPALTGRMRELAARIAPLGDSALLVSISVDPEHDTPEVLGRWAAEQGIQAPRWLALSGPLEATRHLVRQGFLLTLDDANAADPNALLHDTRLVLVDRKLGIRGFYDSTDPARVDQLVEDLSRVAEDDD